MSELKKPESATKEAFLKLIEEERTARGFSSIAKFATFIGISCNTLLAIHHCEFPGQPPENSVNSGLKWKSGRVGTMTRICDKLGFELDTCLAAVGLERIEFAVTGARVELTGEVLLSAEDLRMLLTITETIGSVPLNVALTLLKLHRDKKG